MKILKGDEEGMFRVKVLDEHFGKRTVKLSLLQRLLLEIQGYVYLFHAEKDGWKGKLPFYLVKCKRHRFFFIDYPHGYHKYFNCPLCMKEEACLA